MMSPSRLLPATLALVFALSAAADPLPTGCGKLECPNGDEPITLFTYKPFGYNGGPLLVVFHGVNRNAEDYRDFAIALADRYGLMVVAPLFDEDRFPSSRYQRAGLLDENDNARPPEAWTCAIIPKIVAHVRDLEGDSELPYYLIGHSAGAQFLVRLAAFMPGDAVRIVAANPGSDLFPDCEQKYGYGFGGLPGELGNDDVIRHYLAAPLTFHLGTGDTTPEHGFDASPEGMRQGASRFERGRGCFETARRIAGERGWDLNWRIVETPGVGHEAARMFAADEAGDALFGK